MKQRPDPEIVEEIVTELGGRALRNSEAQAGVERWIELLRGPGKEEVFPVATFGENEAAAKWENRDWYFRDGPHAASIRKAARNLRKALKPFSGALPIKLQGGDRRKMQLQEFRCALAWLGHTEEQPGKFGTKHLAVFGAYSLVAQYSQRPPSGTSGGQVRNIAALLYQAVSGEEADLKRQTDTVFRELRWQEKSRELGRQFDAKAAELCERFSPKSRRAPAGR